MLTISFAILYIIVYVIKFFKYGYVNIDPYLIAVFLAGLIIELIIHICLVTSEKKSLKSENQKLEMFIDRIICRGVKPNSYDENTDEDFRNDNGVFITNQIVEDISRIPTRRKNSVIIRGRK